MPLQKHTINSIIGLVLVAFIIGFIGIGPAAAQKQDVKVLPKDKSAAKKPGDAGTETDASNKPELAMPVKLNTPYKGFLSATDDREDLYKFQVKKGASVSIYLGNDRDSGATLFAEVLYADGKPLEKIHEADANPDPGEGEQLVIDNAPAAVLLLRVRSEKAKQTYSFTIKSQVE